MRDEKALMGKFMRGRVPLGRVLAAGTVAATLGIAVPVLLPVAPAVGAQASTFDGEIADFYRSRSGAPLWFAPTARDAAPQLVQLLATAQADRLNPRRYNVRGLASAVAAARSGDPAAIQRAEAMLSAAFVTYARDMKHDPGVGIVYVDP